MNSGELKRALCSYLGPKNTVFILCKRYFLNYKKMKLNELVFTVTRETRISGLVYTTFKTGMAQKYQL